MIEERENNVDSSSSAQKIYFDKSFGLLFLSTLILTECEQISGVPNL